MRYRGMHHARWMGLRPSHSLLVYRMVYLGELNHCRRSRPISKQRCIFFLVACRVGQRKRLLCTWRDGRRCSAVSPLGTRRRHGTHVRVAGSQGEAAVEYGQPEKEPCRSRVGRIAGNLSNGGESGRQTHYMAIWVG